MICTTLKTQMKGERLIYNSWDARWESSVQRRMQKEVKLKDPNKKHMLSK